MYSHHRREGFFQMLADGAMSLSDERSLVRSRPRAGVIFVKRRLWLIWEWREGISFTLGRVLLFWKSSKSEQFAYHSRFGQRFHTNFRGKFFGLLERMS